MRTWKHGYRSFFETGFDDTRVATTSKHASTTLHVVSYFDYDHNSSSAFEEMMFRSTQKGRETA